MNAAISFLERLSIPQDIDGDTIENVAMNDAIYAIKIAELELLQTLQEYINEPVALYAAIDDCIRKLKQERVKVQV